MTVEEWRSVPEWPSYEVSNLGRVVSHRRGEPRELSGSLIGGYRRVLLCEDDKRARPGVHGLVAAAFIGPRPEGQEVRHLDGDRLNNAVGNLAYGSRADNMQDRLAHGRNPQSNKTHCPRDHAYTADNTYMQGSGRVCRACRRIKASEYRQRQMLRAANVRAAA